MIFLTRFLGGRITPAAQTAIVPPLESLRRPRQIHGPRGPSRNRPKDVEITRDGRSAYDSRQNGSRNEEERGRNFLST